MSRRYVAEAETVYSPTVPGDGGNYDWPALFDLSPDGYLGISQDGDGLERVLLSPRQVQALRYFLAHPGRYAAQR